MPFTRLYKHLAPCGVSFLALERDHQLLQAHRLNFSPFGRCLGPKKSPTGVPRAPQRRPKLPKVVPGSGQNPSKLGPWGCAGCRGSPRRPRGYPPDEKDVKKTPKFIWEWALLPKRNLEASKGAKDLPEVLGLPHPGIKYLTKTPKFAWEPPLP